MKKINNDNFTYTQKDVMVGNRRRSVIIIDKKSGVKLGTNKTSSVNSTARNTTVDIKKRSCGGCARKKRGQRE